MNYGSEGGVERIVTVMPDLAAMTWEPGGGGDHPMMEGGMLSGANLATSPCVPRQVTTRRGVTGFQFLGLLFTDFLPLVMPTPTELVTPAVVRATGQGESLGFETLRLGFESDLTSLTD